MAVVKGADDDPRPVWGASAILEILGDDEPAGRVRQVALANLKSIDLCLRQGC